MSEEPKSSTKYPMAESNSASSEDEIDIIEVIRALLAAWKTILGVTFICMCLAVAFALFAQEIYRADVLLASAQEEQHGSSSAIGQFGGIAAMAGISFPSGSNVEQVIATLKSRKFLHFFIEKKKLNIVLFEDIWDEEKQSWIVDSIEDQPTEQDAVQLFKKILFVNKDQETGLITLSIYWKDPELAACWANDLVKQLNEQLRDQAVRNSKKRIGYLEQELAKTTLQDMRAVLYNLLESEKQKAMLANVNEDFALEVIDPAFAPEILDQPKRKLIVALGIACGGFLGVLVVLIGQFLQKSKSSNQTSKEKS